MIRFLIKGLLRDKSRSRLPVIVVSLGVMLTVFLHAYITGFMGDTIGMNARFSYGHVKVMTRAYAAEMDLVPNDLALTGAGDMLVELQELYPDMEWAPRIQFGGLVDAPDEFGDTRAQGPAMGLGLLAAYIIQAHGIDISGMMEGAALMMPDTIRTQITPMDYSIGFIPGLFSTVAGTMLAGRGIYKRETAKLFKELEA